MFGSGCTKQISQHGPSSYYLLRCPDAIRVIMWLFSWFTRSYNGYCYPDSHHALSELTGDHWLYRYYDSHHNGFQWPIIPFPFVASYRLYSIRVDKQKSIHRAMYAFHFLNLEEVNVPLLCRTHRLTSWNINVIVRKWLSICLFQLLYRKHNLLISKVFSFFYKTFLYDYGHYRPFWYSQNVADYRAY